MCAVRGTKLYGLRIKKDFQIDNNDQLNILKELILSLKKFGSRGKTIKKEIDSRL